MEYVISDLHFSHANIMKYEKRPFKNVFDMDEQMTANWNKKVRKNDKVYVLGDVMFDYNIDNIVNQLKLLNGQKIIFLGNHDRELSRAYRNGAFFNPNGEIYVAPSDYEPKVDVNGTYEKVFMSHYPHFSWNASHHGRKHYYGHVHSHTVTELTNAYNVSADILDFTPQTFGKVIEMQNKC